MTIINKEDIKSPKCKILFAQLILQKAKILMDLGYLNDS